MLTEEQMLAVLKKRAAAFQTQEEFCKLLGVSPGYLSDIINGRRGRTIGDKMAEALGYERVDIRRYRLKPAESAK